MRVDVAITARRVTCRAAARGIIIFEDCKKGGLVVESTELLLLNGLQTSARVFIDDRNTREYIVQTITNNSKQWLSLSFFLIRWRTVERTKRRKRNPSHQTEFCWGANTVHLYYLPWTDNFCLRNKDTKRGNYNGSRLVSSFQSRKGAVCP